MILPKDAFIVKVEKPSEKTQGGLYIPGKSQKIPNKGTILYCGENIKPYEGCTVVFRENFGEIVDIDGVDLMYFRDFNSSIFYVLKD